MDYFIDLHCYNCDNETCNLNKYISPDSQCGCRKAVDEDTFISYQHYMNEVLPLLWQYSDYWKTYERIISFLNNKVFIAPTSGKITKTGKMSNSK